MSSNGPFQLTLEMVREADLMPGDVGAWCLLLDGCYHLFANKEQAERAHRQLLRGVHVR